MKPIIYRRSILALITVCLVMTLFAVGASAASVMRPGSSRSSALSDETADENGIVGGENTTAPGTGEFGNDTSSNMSDSTNKSDTDKNGNDNMIGDAANRVENAVSDVVDGAESAVEDMTGGMSTWTVVIIVAIIAAILALIIAFFTRR